MTALGVADSFKTLAGNSGAGDKARLRCRPGMESRIELDEEQAVTMEIRAPARGSAHPPTSLESEGGGVRKSAAPIVAMNAGNAAGAKGCRCETTDRGNMARH